MADVRVPPGGIEVRFELNGSPRRDVVPAERLLVDHLRDELGLTGTKLGCGVGVCGACTVLVDGVPMTACLLFVSQVEGRRVTTIEGAQGDHVERLRDAFIHEGGFQCGICTPGQIVAAAALLAEDPHPSEERIREHMKGNLCRCTGYYGIVRAIRAAAK